MIGEVLHASIQLSLLLEDPVIFIKHETFEEINCSKKDLQHTFTKEEFKCYVLFL